MKVIFCEECGGKNIVDPELLDKVEKQPLICQICGNVMSQETIIPHKRSVTTVDTLHYHLLFVDDELFHLQLMKTTMEKEYTVSIASTGEQGLNMAEDLQPDLILLDVNMPGMDGYEVCRRLKENQKTRQIPVVFVSARAEGDDEYRGFALGAVDYISKPINLEILNARIAVQLRLKLLLDQHQQQADSLMQSLQQSSMQAEDEYEGLEQEKNNFITIMNSLPERVTIGDMEKRIAWANTATLEHCGMDFSEVLGKYCHEILQNCNAACSECPLSAGVSSSLSVPVEICSQQQGSFCLQTHLPLFDEEGELKGIAHVVTEKTAIVLNADSTSTQVSEAEMNRYLVKNREAFNSNLAAILFGIDAVSSMYRQDKRLIEVSRSIGASAEQLDRMIKEMPGF